MTNYTQANIYRRQMRDLNLNTKQYADLIKMPYEVVKDLLRQNMFNKHQEIENDYENAKYKAMEIKRNDNNYLDWYNNIYSADYMKSKLKLKSVKEFERKYAITINDRIASTWFYTCVVGKINYAGHELDADKKLQFITQLYDIIENENMDEYKKTNKSTTIELKDLENWYKNFDVKSFLRMNDLSTKEVASELNIAYSTFMQLVQKSHYSKNSIEKLYNYIKSKENNEIEPIKDEDLEDDNNTTTKIQSDTLVMFKPITDLPKIESQDDILRRILINRLTDEEKELIRIFGGKLC